MEKGHLYLHPTGFTCCGSWQQVACWLEFLCRQYDTIGALRAHMQKEPRPELFLPPISENL